MSPGATTHHNTAPGGAPESAGDKMSASARDATPPPLPKVTRAPAAGRPPFIRRLTPRCAGVTPLQMAALIEPPVQTHACDFLPAPWGLSASLKRWHSAVVLMKTRSARAAPPFDISSRVKGGFLKNILFFFYISANKLIKLSIRSLTHEP